VNGQVNRANLTIMISVDLARGRGLGYVTKERSAMMTSHFAILLFAATLSGPRLEVAQAGSSGEITDADINRAVERDAPAMIELRHQVHQHPELSNREFETSKLVAERLRSIGLDVRTGVAHTGVVGILKGERPGPVAAVRSELDALPVTEENSLSFKSTVRSNYNGQDVGVAHVCGHDIHIAAILGVASVLASMREHLRGTVIFIFQPAEEGSPAGEEGGAELMLKEGLFGKLKPDAVFAMHSMGTLDVGQIRYYLGPTMAAETDFRIEFHGKQAHAAWPQESIDPVVMAAEAVMELQTIRSRNLAPGDSAVFSVTMLHTGLRTNIIPDKATLGGTIRALDDKVEEQIERRTREIVESIARGADGSADVRFYDHIPAMISDPALGKRMLPALERAVGSASVTLSQPVMGADDLAFFAQVAPAFFFHLGTQKPGTISGINHAPNFVADDSSIPIGMRAMTEVLVEYLQTTTAH
jgi:amidohydrolase